MNEQPELGDAFARSSDPGTSHEAARSVQGTQALSLSRRVYQAIQQHPEGLCSEQLEFITGISNQSLTPRFAPLVRQGLIKDSGRRTRVGRVHQIIWIIGDGVPVSTTIERCPTCGKTIRKKKGQTC
jgi:hypothetical protein